MTLKRHQVMFKPKPESPWWSQESGGGGGWGVSVSFICYSVHVCAVQLSPAVHRPFTGAAGVSVHATFSDLAVPPLKL